ncbi:hypothetical protein HO913_04055 [Streptococcus suis]|nr:hypothetical protein [Streptococcus suis]HEL1557339.1 hypothetical protein [Streptococcus suis]
MGDYTKMMLTIISEIVTIISGLTFIGGLYQYFKAKKFKKELSFLEIIDCFNSSIELIEEKLEILEGWNDFTLYDEGQDIFDEQLNQLRMQENRSKKNALYLDILRTLITYSGSIPLHDMFEVYPNFVCDLVELLVQKSKKVQSDYMTDEILRFRKHCLRISDYYLSIHRGDMEEVDILRYKELNLEIIEEIKHCLETYLKEI